MNWDIHILKVIEKNSVRASNASWLSFKDSKVEIEVQYKSNVEGIYEEKLSYLFYWRNDQYFILEKVFRQKEIQSSS